MKSNMYHKSLAIAMVLLLVSVFAIGSPASAAVIDGAEQGGRPLMTTMTGAEEAPGPGDPDGSGTAFITLNVGQSTVCYELTAENISPAIAAHIHIAPAGSPGPVVIPLTPPTSGFSSGCVSVDQQLIMDILLSPSDYYVNVHTADYPAGAIRGQLGR